MPIPTPIRNPAKLMTVINSITVIRIALLSPARLRNTGSYRRGKDALRRGEQNRPPSARRLPSGDSTLSSSISYFLNSDKHIEHKNITICSKYALIPSTSPAAAARARFPAFRPQLPCGRRSSTAAAPVAFIPALPALRVSWLLPAQVFVSLSFSPLVLPVLPRSGQHRFFPFGNLLLSFHRSNHRRACARRYRDIDRSR